MTQGKGTVFATVGIGGKGLHEINTDGPEARYFAAWSGASTRLDVKLVPAAGYTFTDAFKY